jgi:hypothetical protein
VLEAFVGDDIATTNRPSPGVFAVDGEAEVVVSPVPQSAGQRVVLRITPIAMLASGLRSRA